MLGAPELDAGLQVQSQIFTLSPDVRDLTLKKNQKMSSIFPLSTL